MVLRDFYGIAFWFGLNLQMVDFMREKKKKKKVERKKEKRINFFFFFFFFFFFKPYNFKS